MKRKWWIICFLSILAGSALHFLYDLWPNPLTAVFAPVNESVWEHLKLLFFPVLVYTLFEIIVLFKVSGSFLTARVLGVILGGAGVYDKLVDFAGAGATVPLTGFGNTLAKGVREAVKEQGILGALTGGLKASAAGIAAAVFFGFLAALLCNPKDKS